MAFNVNNFIKNNSKPVMNKLVDNIVGGIVAGLPTSTKSIATSISQSLLNSGSSYTSVDAMSSLKTDSIISGADPNFFAIAGKSLDRASGVSIASLRRSGSESLNQYLSSINPSTKIASQKSRDEFEVISIL